MSTHNCRWGGGKGQVVQGGGGRGHRWLKEKAPPVDGTIADLMVLASVRISLFYFWWSALFFLPASFFLKTIYLSAFQKPSSILWGPPTWSHKTVHSSFTHNSNEIVYDMWIYLLWQLSQPLCLLLQQFLSQLLSFGLFLFMSAPGLCRWPLSGWGGQFLMHVYTVAWSSSICLVHNLTPALPFSTSFLRFKREKQSKLHWKALHFSARLLCREESHSQWSLPPLHRINEKLLTYYDSRSWELSDRLPICNNLSQHTHYRNAWFFKKKL